MGILPAVDALGRPTRMRGRRRRRKGVESKRPMSTLETRAGVRVSSSFAYPHAACMQIGAPDAAFGWRRRRGATRGLQLRRVGVARRLFSDDARRRRRRRRRLAAPSARLVPAAPVWPCRQKYDPPNQLGLLHFTLPLTNSVSISKSHSLIFFIFESFF